MQIRTRLTLIPILLALGGSSFLNAQTLTGAPASLSFSSRVGGSSDTKQLAVTAAGNAAVTFAVFSSQPWLKAPTPPSGGFVTPATLTITADPTNLASNSYTGTLSLVSASSTVTVNVTFVVSPIGASPTSLTFGPYTVGTVPVANQSITLSGTGSFSVAQSSGCTWLSVSPTFGAVPATLTASLNGSIVASMAANTYTCAITITPSGSSFAATVGVTLQVLPTPAVTANPGSMVFNVQSGGSNNVITQTLTIATNPTEQINFFLQPSLPSGQSWLTVSPPNGATDSTTGTAPVTVGVNTTGLTVGNIYNGTLILTTPSGTPTTTNIPVRLNFSSTPFLNVSPSALNFIAQFGGPNPADIPVSATSTDGSLTATYAISVSYSSAATNWLVVPNSGSTAAPFTVSARTAALPPGTYNATVSVTPSAANSTRLDIPVVLTITNNGGISTNVPSMSFPFQIGQSAPAAQNLVIGSVTGVPINYTVTPAVTNCGSGWLLLNSAANVINASTTSSTPISVSIVPSGFAAGTCTGTITISGTNAATGASVPNVVVNVTSVVTSTPQLVATPTSVSVTAAAGSPNTTQQQITLTSTSGTDVLNYTLTAVNQGNAPAGTFWLAATPTQGSTSSGNVAVVFVTPGSLPPDTYSGSVTFTAAPGGSTVIVPVVLKVTAGSLTVSNGSLNFTYTVGAASPATQTVTVGSSTGTPLTYAAAVTNPTQTPWLSASPANGSTSSNPTLTISVDGSKLTTAGTVNGSITVNSPGSTQVINVQVVVTAGTISAPATTLTFTQVQGGTAPAAQTINVTSSPSGLQFTAAATMQVSGVNWLSASPASGTAPGTVSVTVNGGSLQQGTYSGQVTITSPGASGSPINVPVVLTVVPATTMSAQPTSLTFNYTSGLQTPPAQTINLSATPSAPFTVTVSSNAPWLSVTPSSGNAPATLSISVNPGSSAAGTFTGTITISSPNLLTPLTVQVTLNVSTVPKPVINAITNAGSYAAGSVSAGENIVIFGTGLGPVTLVTNTVTNNAFGTTAGNTRVLFDGVAAPVIYASATQTSVMVPYGVAGRSATNIVVEYLGVQSNPVPFVVVGAAPGIYTLNTSGSGPGAIINQDGLTVNAPNTPEKRGNVISVYMTGEGQTSPAGVDGAIIAPVLSALKSPVLQVTATIGGVQATVAYAGSAAGLVSGVMQVNLVIPANAPTGSNVPIVVSVGGTPSQAGVTVAIQ